MTRIAKIKSNNLSTIFGGILDCIDNGNLNKAEVDVLVSLKSDTRIIAGRAIASYAKAALDILGIEKCRDDIDAERLVKEFA